MNKRLKTMFSALLACTMLMSAATVPHVIAEETTEYTVPESPSAVYNMNIDWKYKKAEDEKEWPLATAMDGVKSGNKNFYDVDYDDSAWETVSIPHQVNASDSYTTLGSNEGDTGQYRGIVFYRKHFTVPEDAAGKKLILEFEGIYNAAYVWVNGQKVGYYEAIAAPFAFDITKYVTAGEEAVIAVANDSTSGRGQGNGPYVETRPGSEWGSNDGSGYQWNSHEFLTTQAGLVYNVNLYVKSNIYQTLPIYDNLKTTGTYIWADNFDIENKKATINVKAEVRNETASDEKITLQVDVVKNEETDGEKVPVLKYSFTGEGTVTAATDAGVTYETSVLDDAYSDSKMPVTTELDGVADTSLLEMINDSTKRPYYTTDADPDDVDKNGNPKYFTYKETWSDWTEIPSGFEKTQTDSRGYRYEYRDKDNNVVSYTSSAAVEYRVLEKVEQTRHNESYATEVITADVSYIEASFDASELDFWSTDSPHLYDVYTILKNEDGEIIDTVKTTTGFRKVTYSIEDGLKINDKFVWLTGYAQRSANSWGAIGSPTDWLADYDMSLVKESNANFIRWMHIAPRVNTVRASDKYGVAIVAPAGDKEADASGRAWSQRVEVMRSVMIRFRNNPSVIFWEAGNNMISAIHQQEMTDLKSQLDPNGGRFCGCRTLKQEDQIAATEYVGTMLNRHAGVAKGFMETLDKFVPIVETEYHREESARRVWDDFSPPDYDYDNLWKSDAATAGYDAYDKNSEEFAINDAQCYQEFFKDRVNGASGNNYYAAAAALIWADSNEHGRMTYSENGRMSGRTDAIRIPKQSFYAYQVMQQEDYNGEVQCHLIGHWNYEKVDDLTREEGGNYYYPIKEYRNGIWTKTGEWGRRDPENKTVYAVGSQFVAKMELYVDGELMGTCDTPEYTFIYKFENIDVTSGDKAEVVAYDLTGAEIGRDEITRTGEAVSIRLTPHHGAEGLLADGSDLVYYDVEVIDENGNVCPLAYNKINFTLSGDATFMGGYNSGYAKNKSEGWGAGETPIGKDYVYAECGVNRVFVKAGRNAGAITLTAEFEDGSSAPVSVTVNSVDYNTVNTCEFNGLSNHAQQELDYGEIVDVAVENKVKLKPLSKLNSILKADWLNSALRYVKTVGTEKDYYTVDVNGTTVETTNKSYKPDANTGVITDVAPVLDALLAAGADFTYKTESDAITVYSKKGQNGIDGTMHEFVIKQGQTAIGYDGDPEGILTNAQIELENGQLMMDIAALISYIDGASTYTDTANKTFTINFNGGV